MWKVSTLTLIRNNALIQTNHALSPHTKQSQFPHPAGRSAIKDQLIARARQNIVLDSDVVLLAAQDEATSDSSANPYYMPAGSDTAVIAFR